MAVQRFPASSLDPGVTPNVLGFPSSAFPIRVKRHGGEFDMQRETGLSLEIPLSIPASSPSQNTGHGRVALRIAHTLRDNSLLLEYPLIIMTTPSQHGNKHSSYAQHAVSTPITHLHTPSISTPRSMPSPAVHRSGASKPQHPANPQNASKTSLGGAPMSTSLSQISNASNMSATGAVGLGVMGTGMLGIGTSPSTNLLGFASPAGLAGLDMSTPSAMMDGGGPGAHAMNLSLSDLGIHSGKRNEDEERRVKMDTVLGKLLGKRKRDRGDRFGRVSEEGVTRVGRWAGLDVDIESKWQSKEFEGRRPVQMAGKIALLVEVSLSSYTGWP